ncbi:MAG: glycosyltransferase [Desulfobulbaceae bacterium]|nr:glycosyltransferase [Desulfobulbaceae bacterium]
MKPVAKIRNFLRFFCVRFTPTYRRIAASDWFDAAYYLRAYPDVAASGQDALTHYLLNGYVDGRRPHPLFLPKLYLAQLSEEEWRGVNPLLHYLKTPVGERRSPCHLFDPDYYRSQFPAKAGIDWQAEDAFAHYLRLGEKEGKCPHPYFDPQFYREQNFDANSGANWAHVSPLRHYLTEGCEKRLAPSPFFDSLFYGYAYDLYDKGDIFDLVEHYQVFGIAEGKSPSPLFDPTYYRRENENALAAPAIDSYRHFLAHGAAAGRRPCPHFDPVWYGKHYAIAGGALAAMRHYLAAGLALGHYPAQEVEELAEKPLISLVVPVYNPTPAQLYNCVRSVLYQSYPNWQLCLADDASAKPHARSMLTECARQDGRVIVTFLDKNQGISGASAMAAATATGEFIGFLDNDDELTPDCLFVMAREINRHGGELFYSDEDLIGADGRRCEIFAKPDYNREMLLAHNSITHFLLAKRQLFEDVGGFRPGFDGAQDYDLALRLTEKAAGIGHAPEILYHWRASETSVSGGGGVKDYALEAGRRALEDACQRRGLDADVTKDPELFGYYRCRRRLAVDVAVICLVVWRREPEEFAPWQAALRAKAGYPIAEIYQFDGVDALGKGDENGLYVFIDGLLDDFCDDWLAALIEYWEVADVGMVCGRVRRREDGLEAEWPPWPDRAWMDLPHGYARFIQQQSILMNGLFKAQDVWLATPELFAISAALLRQVGGISTDLSRLFAIHDLSLRLAAGGKRIVYTPYAAAWLDVAKESALRLNEAMARLALARFQKRWRQALMAGDPYYNLARLAQGGLTKKEYRDWLVGDEDKSPGHAVVSRRAGSPLVSVVIPAYNHEKFVGAAVESVLGQSMADLELIVIDDGSTDSTGAIVRSYNDIRLTYIFQENQDAYNTINRGLKLVRGRYISILNSDDVYHHKRLERLLAVQEESGAACLFSAVTPIDTGGMELVDQGHPWNVWVNEKIEYFQNSGNMLAGLFHGNFMLTTSNLFMTSEARRRVGLFSSYRYLHDYDFILRMAIAYPGRVQYLADEKLLSYRLHGSNTISQAAIVGREQDMEIIRKYVLASLPRKNRLAVESAMDRLSLLEHELRQVRLELAGPLGGRQAARLLAASIRRKVEKTRRRYLPRLKM